MEANRPYFDAIYRNAAALTARLCKEFSLDPLEPGVVICHAEGHELGVASAHGDVLQWWPKHGVTMDQFRQDVARAMEDAAAENLRAKAAEEGPQDLSDTAEFPPAEQEEDYDEGEEYPPEEREEEDPSAPASRISFGELQFGRDYEIT